MLRPEEAMQFRPSRTQGCNVQVHL